jgi:HAD superfamily hydrolase (TIGR01509 family)
MTEQPAASQGTPPVQAIIFDLDHTLANTTAVWDAAQHALARHVGCAWTRELDAVVHGLNARDLAAAVCRHVSAQQPVAECQEVMRDALIAAYATARIPEMPGARALVRRLHGRVPLAVASGSPREGIVAALTQLGIVTLFDCVISSEEVLRGKPQPDVFLAVAAALRVTPTQCLVFEDSRVGAMAARAAGMRCFVVPGTGTEQLDDVATRVFQSWREVTCAAVFGTSNCGRDR